MRGRLLCVMGFGGALLAPASATTTLIQIHGTDVRSSYTVGEGLTIAPPTPSVLAGKSLHIEMQMQGGEAPGQLLVLRLRDRSGSG